MPIIKQLPEHLINQIAAGEVVERPASVVKELLENSIDAGADKITIEVNDGGESFLRITDNGSGMDGGDALLAFSRHATSKIESAEDLFRIKTMGFRGEALATIAAVASVSLQTKMRGALEGTLVHIEGGNVQKVSPVGCPEGTQIEIRGLFFNTPARKKYLKNSATEYGHILSTITGVALAFPHVGFTLIHDEKTVFDLPATNEDIVRIRAILGRSVADELVPIFYGHSKIQLSGYIGKPFIARANRNSQYLFVNQREVKSHVLSYAVKQSYHSLLPKEKHPVFLLYFTIDPESVDVNVHPRKLEVRFRDEKEIFSIISQACGKALEKHVLAPVLDGKSMSFDERFPMAQAESRVENVVSDYQQGRQQTPLVLKDSPATTSVAATLVQAPVTQGTTQEALEFTQQFASKYENEPQGNSTPQLPFGQENENDFRQTQEKNSSEPVAPAVTSEVRTSVRHDESEIIPLAQMDASFILCQQGSDLVIVDQHAAHERIRYTEIVEAFEKKDPVVQPLLVPESLELSHRELVILDQYKDLLLPMGFELEPFGGNTIAVHAVPSYAAKLDLQPLIQGILDDLDQNISKGDFNARKERALIYMACRSAVKFGDILALEEQKELIRRLQALALPYTCPHGRPTMIKLTSDELIKRFGRMYDDRDYWPTNADK